MYNQKINNTLHRNKKKYLSSLGMIVTLLILSITTEGLFIVLAIIDSRPLVSTKNLDGYIKFNN